MENNPACSCSTCQSITASASCRSSPPRRRCSSCSLVGGEDRDTRIHIVSKSRTRRQPARFAWQKVLRMICERSHWTRAEASRRRNVDVAHGAIRLPVSSSFTRFELTAITFGPHNGSVTQLRRGFRYNLRRGTVLAATNEMVCGQRLQTP